MHSTYISHRFMQDCVVAMAFEFKECKDTASLRNEHRRLHLKCTEFVFSCRYALLNETVTSWFEDFHFTETDLVRLYNEILREVNWGELILCVNIAKLT